MLVLGIDPGIQGAFVLTDGKTFRHWDMPLKVEGKNKSVNFDGVYDILKSHIYENEEVTAHGSLHIFLERAVSFGMGTNSAFTYGRGFGFLEIAIKLAGLPVTQVSPKEWTKVMHEGISADLKPKVKSLIAIERLYPQLHSQLPRKPKGGLMEGPVDALLIAGFGLRKMGAV
jgi:hypothetical protein